MKSQQMHSLADIYRSWCDEDRELESCIDEIRDWMKEVDQLGIPHFGETATRLRPVKSRLVIHFQREDEMLSQLAEHYSKSSPEVEAVGRQADRDHRQLLTRLEDLIERLEQPVPPFQSWQAAMDEVEMFVDLLEQHEDQEAESIEMLMPAETTRDEQA